MAFDQTTRNRLQRFVNDARNVLEEEFTRQLQNDYGMDPMPAQRRRTRQPAPPQRRAARNRPHPARHAGPLPAPSRRRTDRQQRGAGPHRPRAGLHRPQPPGRAAHGGGAWPADRIGRQRLPGEGLSALCRAWPAPALGETGDAYRVYLFSVFDELAPGPARAFRPLLTRRAGCSRAKRRCLPVLALINDAEIEPLWAEDETIGWIYQYFNSKEERKAMRDASQAPRNSRELAVRNQFFTPRYVVEFLVDNTLGRLWFNATGGQTALRERCQYLLVKPDEAPLAAAKLRDPRTLKLLDPACGSMHFGLYAFDLFETIYRGGLGPVGRIHHRDPEDTGKKKEKTLCPLCPLCPLWRKLTMARRRRTSGTCRA